MPANVHLLRGNASKKPLADLLDSFQPEVEIPDCPPHLLPEARKEWKRVTPELEKYGLVARVDRAALALYCQSWAELVYAERMMNRRQRDALIAQKKAEAAGLVYEGGDGRIVDRWQNGHPVYSPYWAAARAARAQVDKFLTPLGLNASARGRVSVSNNRQSSLFPDDDAGEGAGFDAL